MSDDSTDDRRLGDRLIGADRTALLGAAAVLGSLCLVVSAGGEALLPVPDSYQFDPALTSPQFVRERVLPLVTLAGASGHLAGLLGARRRDREGAGVGWFAGWWLTAAGLVAVGAATATMALLGPAGVSAAIFLELGLALGYLLALVLVGVGITVFGVTVLRRATSPLERVSGALFLLTPVALAAWYVVNLGRLGWVTGLPYPLGWVTLGVDLWRRPADAE